MPINKKRFIAGAVCPKCGVMDRIVMFSENGKDHRECVECGFTDVLHIQPVPRELETRVNISEEQKKSETSVVKIIE